LKTAAQNSDPHISGLAVPRLDQGGGPLFAHRAKGLRQLMAGDVHTNQNAVRLSIEPTRRIRGSPHQRDTRTVLSRAAENVGGEGRTRTFEVIRRLIYSQLPLPLGTLPRFSVMDRYPPDMRHRGPVMTLIAATLVRTARPGAFMGEMRRQSQPSGLANMAREGGAEIAIPRNP
jgi:hypothetical protein